jgi:putative ABC transport system ATP-binding protein
MSHLEVRDLTLDVPGRRLFDGITFAAEPGECIAIMGPSGSGKTSLLNCLCGITTPTAGSVIIDGVDVPGLGITPRSAFRLKHIGLVFQFGELLPELTVVENVSLPLRLLGVGREEAERRAAGWLARLGIGDLAVQHPDRLSGGEAQRAGIARALAHGPALVLADEPTGALDEANAAQVARLLLGIAKETGATVIVATHDPLVATQADRVLRLRDGQLLSAHTPPRNTPPNTGRLEALLVTASGVRT